MHLKICEIIKILLSATCCTSIKHICCPKYISPPPSLYNGMYLWETRGGGRRGEGMIWGQVTIYTYIYCHSISVISPYRAQLGNIKKNPNVMVCHWWRLFGSKLRTRVTMATCHFMSSDTCNG